MIYYDEASRILACLLTAIIATLICGEYATRLPVSTVLHLVACGVVVSVACRTFSNTLLDIQSRRHRNPRP